MPVGVGETRAQGVAGHQECCRLVPGRVRQQRLGARGWWESEAVGYHALFYLLHGGWEAQSQTEGDHSCTTVLQGCAPRTSMHAAH